MKMPLNTQLSSELQELYLENKEWLSDILFLEDEMRFFQNLFDNVLSANVKRKNIQQVEVVSASLGEILQRRKQLKAVLISRKGKLERLLEGKAESFDLELIERDAAIIREIKTLLATDKLVKNELFALIEELKNKDTPVTSPGMFKIQRYPIF